MKENIFFKYSGLDEYKCILNGKRVRQLIAFVWDEKKRNEKIKNKNNNETIAAFLLCKCTFIHDYLHIFDS